MKYHLQAITGENGDCFRTCLACLLDLESPTDVPDFANDPDEFWYETCNTWLRTNFGCQLHYIEADKVDPNGLKHPHLMMGVSPRGFLHCCVGCRGEIVHDPHPDQTGLIEVRQYGYFIQS